MGKSMEQKIKQIVKRADKAAKDLYFRLSGFLSSSLEGGAPLRNPYIDLGMKRTNRKGMR